MFDGTDHKWSDGPGNKYDHVGKNMEFSRSEMNVCSKIYGVYIFMIIPWPYPKMIENIVQDKIVCIWQIYNDCKSMCQSPKEVFKNYEQLAWIIVHVVAVGMGISGEYI